MGIDIWESPHMSNSGYSITKDYVVNYTNSTCEYQYIGDNSSSNIESIIWGNNTRPRLKLYNNSINSKFYTGLNRNDEINMSE